MLMVHLADLVFQITPCVHVLNTHGHSVTQSQNKMGRESCRFLSRLAAVSHKGTKRRADGTGRDAGVTEIGQTVKRQNEGCIHLMLW